MAAIRERGGQFHVQVRMAGFPARTASFPTRRQAERWSKTIEAEMIEGRHFRNVEARRRTVADAIDRYAQEELPQKAGGRMSRLRYWREHLGHLKLAEVSAAIIIEHRNRLARQPYIRARPDSKRTTLKEGEKPREFKRSLRAVDLYLAYFSHVLSVARKQWHWISHNPFDGVAKLAKPSGRVRFLSQEEREALLIATSSDPQLHLLVVLALTTAARAGELVDLTWHDVDLKEGRIFLQRTKNRQPRTLWVQGEALKLLKEHAKVRRLEDDRVFRSLKGRRYDYSAGFEAACKAAKVADFRFHDLRHSAATYLAREGATEQQLKAIGGWKSGVVSRYVHLAAEDARGVLARMNEKILPK